MELPQNWQQLSHNCDNCDNCWLIVGLTINLRQFWPLVLNCRDSDAGYGLGIVYGLLLEPLIGVLCRGFEPIPCALACWPQIVTRA